MRKQLLWIDFLNIKGLYNDVNQEQLWVQLREYDLGAHLITLSEDVYTNNEVVITWEVKITEPVEIKRGLGQGCPL